MSQSHCWGRHCFSQSESTGPGHLTSSGLSFLHPWVLLLSTYAEQPITREEPLQFFLWASLLSVRVPLTGSANIPSLSHSLATLSKPEAGAAADPRSFSVSRDHCPSLPDIKLLQPLLHILVFSCFRKEGKQKSFSSNSALNRSLCFRDYF